MMRKSKTEQSVVGDDVRLSESDLLRALSHPTRVKILAVVAERVASPSRIAQEIGEEVGHVGYHARVLRNHGLIELVDEKPVRGAVEHFYRAVERPWFDEECWAAFDPEVKKVISSYGIDLIVRDIARALKAGTFDSRDQRHLSRAPMLLDAEGFAKVGQILDGALDAIIAEQAASDERRRESHEAGIATITAMMSFEVPPRPKDGSSSAS